MVLLKVSYRIQAHEISEFENIFTSRILPLIEEHQLGFRGIWKTLVGDAGEFLELWEFESLSDFETRWKGLLNDPRLQEIFQITGKMVQNENVSLLEPVRERTPL